MAWTALLVPLGLSALCAVAAAYRGDELPLTSRVAAGAVAAAQQGPWAATAKRPPTEQALEEAEDRDSAEVGAAGLRLRQWRRRRRLGADGKAAEASTNSPSRLPHLLPGGLGLGLGPQLSVREVPRRIVGEGEACNRTAAGPPESAALACKEDLVCAQSKRLTGAPYVCTKRMLRQVPDGPKMVGEGETCNGSLPPEFATICKDGLLCIQQTPLDGAPGVCTKSTGPVLAQSAAGAGDVCNGTQIVCQEGLDCIEMHLPGAPGICINKGAKVSTGPTVVGENMTCNPSLPHNFVTLCKEGLQCVQKVQLRGAPGICTTPAATPATEAPPPRPKTVGEGGKCNGSLPPKFATFCEEGLQCIRQRPLPGAPGICTKVAPKLGDNVAPAAKSASCDGNPILLMIKNFSPECFTACPQVCQPMALAIKDYLGNKDLSRVVCQWHGEFSCVVQADHVQICGPLLEKAENGLHLKVPHTLEELNAQCSTAPAVHAPPNRTGTGKDQANGTKHHQAASAGRVCCEAMIASCMACKAGQGVLQYCQRHPEEDGCPKGLGNLGRHGDEGPAPVCSRLPERMQVEGIIVEPGATGRGAGGGLGPPYDEGTVLVVSCEMGFTGSQSTWELVCLEGDNWTAHNVMNMSGVPECRPIRCEAPSDPLGTWQWDRGQKQRTLQLECAEGYKPDGGAAVLSCTEPNASDQPLARCTPSAGDAGRWRRGLQSSALVAFLGAAVFGLVVVSICWREPPAPAPASAPAPGPQAEATRLVDRPVAQQEME